MIAVLKSSGLFNLEDKVSRILALLARLFYDFHKKDLQFVKIFEGPQREKIMHSLDPLGSHIRFVLLQGFDDTSMEPQGLVVSMEAMNTVHQLGLTRKRHRTHHPNVHHPPVACRR